MAGAKPADRIAQRRPGLREGSQNVLSIARQAERVSDPRSLRLKIKSKMSESHSTPRMKNPPPPPPKPEVYRSIPPLEWIEISTSHFEAHTPMGTWLVKNDGRNYYYVKPDSWERPGGDAHGEFGDADQAKQKANSVYMHIVKRAALCINPPIEL